MKNLVLFIICVLMPVLAFSQVTSENAEELNSRWQMLQSGSLNSAQLTFQHTNVSGTPYLFDDMEVSKMKFQGQWTEEFLGNYDIANNVVEVLRGAEKIYIDAYQIQEFVVDDKTLRNDFPVSDEYEITKSTLLEVIYQGDDFSLVIRHAVNLREGQMTYSNATKNEYYDKTSAVLFLKDGNYTKTKMKRKDILRLFEENKDEIHKYARQNKLKYDESEDLSKILEYADSLS